jgi:hypothetical protein
MVNNTYPEDKDKLYFIDKELEQYVPVNVFNLQCCQVCGFELCFCKDIVGLNAESRYWIIDDRDELSN